MTIPNLPIIVLAAKRIIINRHNLFAVQPRSTIEYVIQVLIQTINQFSTTTYNIKTANSEPRMLIEPA